MPIKEILTWTTMICAGWYAVGGTQGMLRNIRKAQIAILREVVRVDDWGNPAFSKKSKRPRAAKYTKQISNSIASHPHED